ncbi:MAG: metallophosphatase family protein [Candidatus Brocadiaceae bacterium]|nr:metallophosphatase family protein [Candidatus Brocadiaceae bacterium]
MLYGVIGDIHSNYEALLAVAEELNRERVDQILCVGDIVGYGADPCKCIELVRELNCVTVAGNHDYAVIEKFPVSYFNEDAKNAALWTIQQLSKDCVDYLKGLPLIVGLDTITLVHGSLNRPEMFNYIVSGPDALASFYLMKTQICFYGHTHVPLANFFHNDSIFVDKGHAFDLVHAEKAMINVGSVGQPRDWDARASYALYDTNRQTVEIKRVKYDIHNAVNKIYEAGLPESSALRLLE